MEVDGIRTSLTKFKCRMALWILMLVVALFLPGGVFANHRPSIDERNGISARDSGANTRMSSRNTRNRSGSQPAASPSRVIATDQRNRLSERCVPGRTCDQSLSNSRSSVRTQGRAVPTSQGSQRRGSSRSSSLLSSRARTPSRSSVPSRPSVSSRSRPVARASETSRTSVPPRNRAIPRTSVAVRDRVASRASGLSRASVPTVSSRDSVALRSSGSSRVGVSSRTRVPSRVSSRAGGSSRSTSSTRSNVRSPSPLGVALRNSSSSSGTSSRGSNRAITRGTSRGSTRGSSSGVGIPTRTSARGTSRIASRGSSGGVSRATSRSNSGKTSTRGTTGQRTRSSRVQQTPIPSITKRVKAVPNSELRSRSNNRGGSANRGTGSVVNNAMPPSVNRFLNELKSSMPGSVGMGVGMSMANGPKRATNTRQPSRSRPTSSSARPAARRDNAVNQRQTGSSSRRMPSDQRLGSLGSQRTVSVDRVQPIIRPTFQDSRIGIDNQPFVIRDNLHADPFIANDFFIDPQGSSLSGNDQTSFVDNQRGTPIAINDGLSQNSLDIPVSVSNMNQGIIQNLDQFVPHQQNQFGQDSIVPHTQIQNSGFTQGQAQHDPIIRGTSQLSHGQIIGVQDQGSTGRTRGVVGNDNIQPNDQRIVMDMHGIQTQTRAVEPIIGINQNVVNTGQGQSGQIQGQSVAVDPIIRNHQFIQGNTVGNVFGRVSVQSQGHSPIQQVQQPTEQIPIHTLQHQHQLNQLPVQQVPSQVQAQIVGVNNQVVAGTQSQIPIDQPTFINSNTQKVIQPLIGSNTMQIPQQRVSPLALIPDISLHDTTMVRQPTPQSNIIMTSNNQGGVGQSATTRGGIAIQNTAINSPIQHNGQAQQHIGAHDQHQQAVGVSQTQFLDPVQTVNHNQFSTSINGMQQNFPIPNAPIQDHSQVQSQVQGQGQMVQDQTAFASSGTIGQFVTPQPLDQSHLNANRFQHNIIQTSGVIHQNQNVHPVISSQLTGHQGQGSMFSHNGGIQIQQPISQTAHQDGNAHGGQINVQTHQSGSTQPLHHAVDHVNQPIAAGGSIAINQPLLQTVNHHPVNTNNNPQHISAIGGQVLNNIQHAQTINQINDILNSQQAKVVATNPSSDGSVGTIGGQTFQGIAPAAAPVQNPLLNQVTPPPNGLFGSITTANPKRMLIHIDSNSKGVKIVPDGMGGVRVISLREAVTISPFGNGNETGLMALLDTAATQSPVSPMSVPLGSAIISQSILLNTLNSNKTAEGLNKKLTTKRPFFGEPEVTEKEITFTGVTDIPEELEINGTSPDGTPPNAGLDAGAIPTTKPTSAALSRVTQAATFMSSAEILATTQKTPVTNLPVTDINLSEHMLTTQKKSQDDEEDNSSDIFNTVNIIDHFYGGMRQELVRNTNIIQELINKLAVIEYKKNKQAIDKTTKDNQSSDLLMNSVLNELVKLENTRAKEVTTVHNIFNKRSTSSTTRWAGITQRVTTTSTPVVTTASTVQSGYPFTWNTGTPATVNHSTSRKPLSIEDIHKFLHSFPNSNDILKRLADIFANNKTYPASAISNVTQTPSPKTESGLRISNILSSSITKTTKRRVTQTSGVTEPTTTVVTTAYPVPRATSAIGLPARMTMTSINGDISFGDESAHRLNKLRQPVHVYNGKVRTRHNNQRSRNEFLKTSRKSNQFTTTERNVIVPDPYSAVFSLKNGNRHSNVAVYGTQVVRNRNQHHVRGHNTVDHLPPGQRGNKVETTVRFRPMVTTSKTTPRQGGIYMGTASQGGPASTPSPAALSMTMEMPTTAKISLNNYRGGQLAGSALSEVSSYMPLFGQDMMKSFDIKSSAKESINKRIEPNLNNIFSKALQIQSPNGMQIKQLPRAKRTSSGLHTIV